MASISRGLRFIPLLWSVLLVITVITSHLISKFCNSPDFLFTSGFQLVQSTFSELLDLLSLVGIASVVVRYLNLELVTRGLGGEVHSRVSSLRLASLAFGFGSMLGIMFISNFRQPNQQEHTEITGTLHYVGRMFVGVCGITYCALQAVITLYLGKLQISHVKLFVLRTVISSLLCVSGLVHVTMDVLLAFRLLERNHQRYKPWYSSWIDTMPSLTDFISDISEWLMFLLFAMFSATYFREFRDLGIEMSCFSKDSRREQGTSIKNYSPMLMQRESAGSDQD